MDNNVVVHNQNMSVVDWLITLVVMMIPCVGIVMMFVWSFSGTGNPNRKTFCRAYLVVLAAAVVLSFIVAIFFAAIFSEFLYMIIDVL